MPGDSAPMLTVGVIGLGAMGEDQCSVFPYSMLS